MSDAEELEELRRLFAIQRDRMSDATARWRAEDPEARALTMPDLGDLLRWLMDQVDEARAATADLLHCAEQLDPAERETVLRSTGCGWCGRDHFSELRGRSQA